MPNIERYYEIKETNQEIYQFLKTLPEKERLVIDLYFGVTRKERYNQREIAEKLGVSQGSISRIKKHALLKLKQEILRQIEEQKQLQKNIKTHILYK